MRPKSGKVEDAALALERLVPQDIVAVAPGRQRYAQFTNPDGGILDDLMVANFGDHLFLVVNAACKAEDEAHLRAHLSDACVIESLADRALIALQGPKAESALAKFCADVDRDAIHGCRSAQGRRASTASSRAPAIPARTVLRFRFRPNMPKRWCKALLENSDVLPIGLGARDSLRLEAGLCLYGHDIDTTTTPVEGALEWSVQKSRRSGGARAGGFPGADVILAQFEKGAARRRVGLRPEGRAPVREGAVLFADATLGRADRQGHVRRLRPEPQCARRDGLSADRSLPRPARRSSPKSAASACRCRSPPCHSFPTPTNAEAKDLMTIFVHDRP